jgi:hypothetical protein
MNLRVTLRKGHAQLLECMELLGIHEAWSSFKLLL